MRGIEPCRVVWGCQHSLVVGVGPPAPGQVLVTLQDNGAFVNLHSCLMPDVGRIDKLTDGTGLPFAADHLDRENAHLT